MDDERKHFIKCPVCGELVDCRDLSQVFQHLHADLPDPDWSSSRRIGDPEEFLPDGSKVDLN